MRGSAGGETHEWEGEETEKREQGRRKLDRTAMSEWRKEEKAETKKRQWKRSNIKPYLINKTARWKEDEKSGQNENERVSNWVLMHGGIGLRRLRKKKWKAAQITKKNNQSMRREDGGNKKEKRLRKRERGKGEGWKESNVRLRVGAHGMKLLRACSSETRFRNINYWRY